MKKKKIIFYVFLALLTGCTKKEINDVNRKIESAEKYISEIKNPSILKNCPQSVESKYYLYYIRDEKAISKYYNGFKSNNQCLLSRPLDIMKEYKDSNYLAKYNEVFIVNDRINSTYYTTMSDSEKCYVKKFGSDELNIYNIGDSKCHIPYAENDKVEVVLYTEIYNTKMEYESGYISKEPVVLSFETSIFDSYSYTYELYRNEEKIDFNDKLVIDYKEAAEYYVKIKTNDGKEYTSNKIYVIVDM